MSDLKQAAQQMLEAIDRALPYAPHRGEFDAVADTADDLRAALARHSDDVAIAKPHGGGIVYMTSEAATDAAIRAKLVELGWTPPTALAQQAEPVAYSELKPWAHASRVQSDEETHGLGVDDFGRCGSSSSAVVGCSGLVAGSEFAARERRVADMNRAQQAEPVAYLYSTIADVAVFHRVQQIGHAEALYSQAQLANDMKAAREYPNAHSVVALYTAPPRREWVSLTDEEIKTVLKQVAESIDASSIVMTHWPLVARAVEAALKEKNK